MLKVYAKFKGANRSLNYRRNAKYHLNFIITNNNRVEICDANYTPDNPNAGQVCIYASLHSFLSNWEVIN